MNLYLVLLDVCFISVLIWFLAGERDGWVQTIAGVAFGLLVYLSGHLWIRGWTWINWFQRTGSAWQQEPTQVIMFSVGLAITTVGLVLIARHIMFAISPKVWYTSVIGSAILAVAITWLT